MTCGDVSSIVGHVAAPFMQHTVTMLKWWPADPLRLSHDGPCPAGLLLYSYTEPPPAKSYAFNATEVLCLTDRTPLCLAAALRCSSIHADPHPGNVAVDAEGGGRLIYYDFGMMGSIPGGVRGGLMELFYGVYEKDADK
jgi:hypothetical protein